MLESGQKQSQTEGRSNLLPLDTGNESNLTIVLPPPGIIKLEELTKLNLLENKQLC